MEATFNLCVDFLLWISRITGLTYVEINVWIFCIIWPLITMGLVIAVTTQAIMQKIRKNQRINTSIERS
jgi:hypothetical protein